MENKFKLQIDKPYIVDIGKDFSDRVIQAFKDRENRLTPQEKIEFVRIWNKMAKKPNLIDKLKAHLGTRKYSPDTLGMVEPAWDHMTEQIIECLEIEVKELVDRSCDLLSGIRMNVEE